MTHHQDHSSSQTTLTPFELAEFRIAEFAENCIQSHMWQSITVRYCELSDKQDPASMTERFTIENFMSEAIKAIPTLTLGDA